ncbi:ATP-binding cassette domain-containing protein [Streptomyces sp. NPDC059862]|uniref:ABC transporter ATP-binding protein n=1 Tax=Streptomyces sp. NPDC059862 TaxID=3346975 RepID=UPI0036629EDC
MIQAFGLTSNPRKGLPPAVDDVSFEARAGRVTALLGDPGAGKTTALRLMLELQQGRGVTYFRGRPLHRIAHPSREVGVLLGDVPGHPGRTVRSHLRMLCAAAGISVRRADEVLEVVGLVSLSEERLGTLSRGMDRRLGLACALLSDPHTLVLDEPSDGLSARESRWLYGMLRAHAGQGGTVLVTTADPKEAARTVDRVVTLERGRLVADQEATEFARTRLRPRVAVRSPQSARLAALLTREARTAQRSVEVVQERGNRLSVYGSTCADVGETAYRHGILVLQLADEIGDMGPGAGAAAPEEPQVVHEWSATADRPDPETRRTAHLPQGPDGASRSRTATHSATVDKTPPDATPATTPATTPSSGSPTPHATTPHADADPDADSVPGPRSDAAASQGTVATSHATTSPSAGHTPHADADHGVDSVPGPRSDAAASQGTVATSHATTSPSADHTPHADADHGADSVTAPRPDAAASQAAARTSPAGPPPTTNHSPHPDASTGPEPQRPASVVTPSAKQPAHPTPTTAHRPPPAAHPASAATDPAPLPAHPAPTAPRIPDALPPLPPPISVRPAPSPLRPLRYELRRAAGVSTGFVTGAVVLVVSALTAVFLAGVGHTPQARLLAAWPQEMPLPPAALGAGLLGALAFGDEFRYPALAADRGTVPRRLGLLAAKLLVSAATALILAVLTLGCDAEVLYLVYGRELVQVPSDWLSLTASWLGLTVGCAWAGVLAAGVFRSTAGGLAAVVAVPIVVVPLVQKAFEGPSVRTAAGLPMRARELFLLQWPFGGERYLSALARVIAQPVGGALTLSLTALLCAFLLTTLRSRTR